MRSGTGNLGIIALLIIAILLAVLMSPGRQQGVGARTSLKCPSHSQVEAIRAEPTSITAAFHNCLNEIKEATAPLELTSDADLFAVFVMVVSHRMAPYGNSVAINFNDLLREPVLDCDNYMLLAARLYEIGNIPEKGLVTLVGFDGGPIGNHAQLFYVGRRSMLLDPTVAIAAITRFDDLLMGVRVSSVVQLSSPWVSENTRVLAANLIDALRQGSYRPSHLLYHFPSADAFAAWSRITTPKFLAGARGELAPYLPTPGFRP